MSENSPGISEIKRVVKRWLQQTSFDSPYERKTPDKLLWLDNTPLTVGLTEKFYFLQEEEIDSLAKGTVSLINLCVAGKIETVLFLDKSARPSALLFLKTWQNIFPNSKHPDIRFMDIGRDKHDKYEKLPSSDELKRIYGKDYEHYQRSFTKKTILVADEIISSGSSIMRAKQVIEKAFPQAGKTYYTAIYSYRGPSWYGSSYAIGVTDPDPNDPKSHGGFFVSPTHIAFGTGKEGGMKERRKLREKSIALRRDLGVLARMIADKVEVMPTGNFVVEPLIPDSAPLARSLRFQRFQKNPFLFNII